MSVEGASTSSVFYSLTQIENEKVINRSRKH